MPGSQRPVLASGPSFSACHAPPGCGQVHHLWPGPGQGQHGVEVGPLGLGLTAWRQVLAPPFITTDPVTWEKSPQCPQPMNEDKNSV